MNRVTRSSRSRTKFFQRAQSLDVRGPKRAIQKAKRKRAVSPKVKEERRVKWAEDLEDVLIFDQSDERKAILKQRVNIRIKLKSILLNPIRDSESDTESTKSSIEHSNKLCFRKRPARKASQHRLKKNNFRVMKQMKQVYRIADQVNAQIERVYRSKMLFK
jgi:hypothetical protein